MRHGKYYNRHRDQHHGALLIHVERKRMCTAISTLAHSIAPSTHRVKLLHVHVQTISHDHSKACAGHRQIARILE